MGEDIKPIFGDLDANDLTSQGTEIEDCLCVNCGQNGTTRVLLTRIPFYKDVVIMSFECESCGYKNNEIQSGGSIDETGVRITLEVKTAEDLNRQVVKSDYTSIKIPQVDLEIPSRSQNGEVTTVEGVINRIIAGLDQLQNVRKQQHPELAKQIDDVIEVLNTLKLVEKPFTMIFEDLSGNSFVENRFAPAADSDCKIEKIKRTKEQDHFLGIYAQEEVKEIVKEDGLLPNTPEKSNILEDLQGEVLAFHTNCPKCSTPCDTNMKVTNIPYFKEVVIMATSCDSCGHRTNEVKSGGGVEPKGISIEVQVRGVEDFSRDLLKSETCRMSIPELELEAGAYTLGGKFTTVEGLIKDIKEGLEKGSASLGIFGDSRSWETGKAVSECVSKLENVLQGTKAIKLILNDPAGNSYVQSLNSEGLDDGLKILHYERTFEENEELGLNDMKTEGYEEEHPEK